MQPSTIFLIGFLCFLAGFLFYPLFLSVQGKWVIARKEWDNQNTLFQEMKTNLAVSQAALKTKSEEEFHLLAQVKEMSQELNLLKGESERDKSAREIYEKQVLDIRAEWDRNLEEWKSERNEFQNLHIENARLKEQMLAENEKYLSQKQDLEKIGEKFETHFRNLANNILEDRTQKFDLHQQTSLKHILEPLQKDIETFKKDFSEKFQQETSQIMSLGSHLETMMKMSHKLSDEAHHLTQALKGQVKQQGNWGEAILESILQFAGLQKGVQYFVQESHINESGNRILPDIRVHYPDNKHIIIDSKVSLLHYERYSNADTHEEKSLHLDALLKSIKNHIADLGSKDYQNAKDNTLDFVMMFIPVEGAYITAMQADQELWQHAYKKRILLMSPTNLIAAMKLVQDFWQKDLNHKNSEQIVNRASALYDKLAGFAESFNKIGDSLNKAEQAFTNAKKQLSTGNGNLMVKAEQMKRMNGMKTNKTLPSNLLGDAFLEEDLESDAESQMEESDAD